MCKSHENGCTWSLGACCSTRTRSSTTRKTRHSTYHPTNGQNKFNHLHLGVDCRDQNVHELYPILQKRHG